MKVYLYMPLEFININKVFDVKWLT